MASGNKVFRAKVTFFAGKVKVPLGALVREGHAVLNGAERYFEELKVDFERDDIKAKKDADAAAAKAAADAKKQADADAKAAVKDVAKVAEADATKVVAGDAVKAVEADVEKAAN